MRTIKMNLGKILTPEIKLITACLKQGGVIAYPTDTVYGLGCLADNKKAILKIKKIKGMDKDRSLLVLVSSLAMLKKYCRFNKSQERYLKQVWPGPVTVVLNGKDNLPKELTGKSSGLAVRLPKNDFLIKLIRSAGAPLTSTSLNKTGDLKPLRNVKNLGKYFTRHQPDLVIDAGILRTAKPSKIVDIRNMENIRIIRP